MTDGHYDAVALFPFGGLGADVRDSTRDLVSHRDGQLLSGDGMRRRGGRAQDGASLVLVDVGAAAS